MIKIVKYFGNGGAHVTLPISMLGKRVRIEVIDDELCR